MNSIIKKVKNQLIKKVIKKGLYENFGQTEIRKLMDNPLCNPYGTTEERKFHEEVMVLDEWCSYLNDREVQHLKSL